MKRIPRSFKLGGFDFQVHLVDAKTVAAKAGEEAYGVFIPDELAIYLVKPSRKLKKAIVLQTFWHEFTHAQLWVANDRWTDEKLVDHCGHLIHQFFSTVKFK